MDIDPQTPKLDGPPHFQTRVMLIERSLLLLLVGGLLAGVMFVIKPFTTAILFGGATATAVWPLRQFIIRCGAGRGFTALLLFLLSFFMILMPLLIIAPQVASQVGTVSQKFEMLLRMTPDRPGWIDHIPFATKQLDALWDHIVESNGNLRVLITPYMGDVQAVLLSAAGTLASSLGQVLLSLIVATMFWVNGDNVVAVFHEAMRRLGGPVAERTVDVAGGAIRGVAYGVIGTAGIQALALTIGLAIAGVPETGTLGFIALLLAISQIGAPLLMVIWGGAAWWLFHQDANGWGIFVIVWGVVVTILNNLLSPWLIGLGMQIPMTLTLLGVFGGFVAFGIPGLFVGPTLLAIAYSILGAWREALPKNDIGDL